MATLRPVDRELRREVRDRDRFRDSRTLQFIRSKFPIWDMAALAVLAAQDQRINRLLDLRNAMLDHPSRRGLIHKDPK